MVPFLVDGRVSFPILLTFPEQKQAIVRVNESVSKGDKVELQQNRPHL